MPSRYPHHGGTDSLPDPDYDFSSNVNPLGACPTVRAALRAADVTRYPDPRYVRLRDKLAAFHHTAPEQIIVGAGGSELILRLIQRFEGTVQELAPTFAEYAHGAYLVRRRLISARTPATFLRAQAHHPGLGFVCWPNNPTGDCWPAEFIKAAATAGPLVVDLAYAPFCDAAQTRALETAARQAYRLYVPNKAFGVPGVRGAYLIAPRPDRRLAELAPSWVIGTEAVALLEASITPDAQDWLLRGLPRIARWRRALTRALRSLGLDVRESPATFVLVRVPSATRTAARLRQAGVRVRDGSSFGLRDWIRLSAQPPVAQQALLTALGEAL